MSLTNSASKSSASALFCNSEETEEAQHDPACYANCPGAAMPKAGLAMTYQELSEVRQTLRVEWYRSPTRPGMLRELSRRESADAARTHIRQRRSDFDPVPDGFGPFGMVPSGDRPIDEWLNALHRDQPDEHRNSIRWSRILLLFHAVLLIAIITGLWVLPLIFSVSVFIGNWLSYFVGLTQHCGLREDIPDFRKNTARSSSTRFSRSCIGA